MGFVGKKTEGGGGTRGTETRGPGEHTRRHSPTGEIKGKRKSGDNQDQVWRHCTPTLLGFQRLRVPAALLLRHPTGASSDVCMRRNSLVSRRQLRGLPPRRGSFLHPRRGTRTATHPLRQTRLSHVFFFWERRLYSVRPPVRSFPRTQRSETFNAENGGGIMAEREGRRRQQGRRANKIVIVEKQAEILAPHGQEWFRHRVWVLNSSVLKGVFAA